ncbi:putative methyltransferase [Bremerella volcania]|uniref:Methyltransferase n=1 Tax=Bremerella volcania TaxID=2527984 RepID=A0A518CFX4_9BACT|nr:DNA methyltransferase [Bremerella volcania]QDU78133.1 putative methyltransferase [Bremerella volcania]
MAATKAQSSKLARTNRSLPKRQLSEGDVESRDQVRLHYGDALELYGSWRTPICIVSDGPYGIKGFPGDPPTPETLPEIYRPHIEAWSRYSTPETTLWFWNTELGWATVHPILVANGWEYRCCHIWDKGLGHVAGNANSQTLRKFPVVTEVCVQYVKPARFRFEGREVSMQEWLRLEWLRTGLPLSLTNEACNVRNAATRKYFTKCHLWYFPPVEAFERLVAYANTHGATEGKPYFSIDGNLPLSGEQWSRMRAKFHCEVGINNVWREPPVRGVERLKEKYRCVHNNQKPLRLIDICIQACTEPGDVVWEPFGGLCSAAIASHSNGRACHSAEIMPEYWLASTERLKTYDE